MQYLDRLLDSLDVREKYSSEGHTLNAKNLHTYLAKVLYKRRSDFNPLWNMLLVAGLDDDDKPFLSLADLLGTTYSAPTLATGFGAHLAQPLLRRLVPEDEASVPNITKEQAIEAVKECMKVLFYRDARSMGQVQHSCGHQGGDRSERGREAGESKLGFCRSDQRLWDAGELASQRGKLRPGCIATIAFGVAVNGRLHCRAYGVLGYVKE